MMPADCSSCGFIPFEPGILKIGKQKMQADDSVCIFCMQMQPQSVVVLPVLR